MISRGHKMSPLPPSIKILVLAIITTTRGYYKRPTLYCYKFMYHYYSTIWAELRYYPGCNHWEAFVELHVMYNIIKYPIGQWLQLLQCLHKFIMNGGCLCTGNWGWIYFTTQQVNIPICNMGDSGLPDIYTQAWGYIYQANPWVPMLQLLCDI